MADLWGMQDATTIGRIRDNYQRMAPVMNERARRLWAATEARSLGWGGVTAVAQATGLTRKTIHKGIAELEAGDEAAPTEVLSPERSRRAGAGRKPVQQTQPALTAALDALIEPTARGDPISPLRWTCLSTRKLAEQLRKAQFRVSPRTVAALLKGEGYSLQANRKMRQGASHPDRNAQFEYINAKVKRFQRGGSPVVSVDTKKKELVGNFKNNGRTWRKSGQPEQVNTHDFIGEGGKAIPYGVYDVTHNEGWVSVGTNHDTARFACQALRRWWMKMGRKHYPDATRLLITADAGGSNGSRSRVWKLALQELADHLGLAISVCHFPPGTSKWNKIEHRMFSHITSNWRGRPLESHEVIVNLIGHTTTAAGLKIKAALDKRKYKSGEKVPDKVMAQLNIKPDKFHGDWNYTIRPNAKL